MPISPGFIVISKIKPVKDETTGGAAPIRSVLQPGITRIPGVAKQEIQRRWSAHMQSTRLNLPFRYYILSFAILSICSYTAFYRKIRSLLLQPASSLPSDSAAVDIFPESAQTVTHTLIFGSVPLGLTITEQLSSKMNFTTSAFGNPLIPCA